MIELTYEKGVEILTPVVLFVLGITMYSIFIFKFYRFIARRDILRIDLQKYNNATLAFVRKGISVIFYTVEYILIFPLLVFSWFLTLVVLLGFLSREQSIQNILLISIALVAAVRIAAYYSEDLSKDLGKMLPFALLGVFLVDIAYFSLDRTMTLFIDAPNHWEAIPYYLIFVAGLEFVLRTLFILFHREKKEEHNKRVEES